KRANRDECRRLYEEMEDSRCWGTHVAAVIHVQFSKERIQERKEEFKMLITKKMLVALTLVGALVGAGIGALATHSASSNTQAANTTPAYDTTQTANQTQRTPEEIASTNASQFQTSQEQTAYRQGFDDGYTGCTNAQAGTSSAQAGTSSRTVAYNTYS